MAAATVFVLGSAGSGGLLAAEGKVVPSPATPCAELPPDLAAQRTAWQGAARTITAADRSLVGAPGLPPGRYAIELRPVDTVSTLIDAGRKPMADRIHGGFIHVQIAEPGRYRLIMDDRAWIEWVDPASGAALAPELAEPRLICGGMGKNVALEIPRPGRYPVQITEGIRPLLQFLVVRIADR